MLCHSTNSTELVVLDFESPKINLAPSTSTLKPEKFPGISDNVLEKFAIKKPRLISDDEATNNITLKVLLEHYESHLTFISEIETPVISFSDAYKRQDARHWLVAINLELKCL